MRDGESGAAGAGGPGVSRPARRDGSAGGPGATGEAAPFAAPVVAPEPGLPAAGSGAVVGTEAGSGTAAGTAAAGGAAAGAEAAGSTARSGGPGRPDGHGTGQGSGHGTGQGGQPAGREGTRRGHRDGPEPGGEATHRVKRRRPDRDGADGRGPERAGRGSAPAGGDAPGGPAGTGGARDTAVATGPAGTGANDPTGSGTDPADPADPTGTGTNTGTSAAGGGKRAGVLAGARTGLRGWGGVAAMAAACAITAGTLIPLSKDAGSALPLTGEAAAQGRSVSVAQPATADTCTAPEESLRPSSADGPNIEAIRARGKLIVGVDQNSYRWGYRNPATGALEGFDIDLARAIAADLLGDRNAVIFRAIPTNQRIPALNNGTVDIVVRTMTINCARIKQVAFSTAYFQSGQQVLASKGSGITGYDITLQGKRVCTAEGSTAYDALEKKSYNAIYKDDADGTPADEDILTVPNQLDCLVRLQQGMVDAVVTDSALAAGQAAQDPAVELKGTRPFTVEYYGVATQLGKDDLVRRINRVLESYRQGPWQAAYDKWLKADLPGVSGPPTPKYRTG
jgi:polar amino acid transport system substrate-binding protein